MDQQFKRVGFDVRMVRLQPWKLWLLAGRGRCARPGLGRRRRRPVPDPGAAVPGGRVRGPASAPRWHARRRRAALPRGPDVIEGRYEVLDLPRDRTPALAARAGSAAQAVLAQKVVERRPADADQAGGRRQVAVAARERPPQHGLLDLVAAPAQVEIARLFAGVRQVQVRGRDPRARRP